MQPPTLLGELVVVALKAENLKHQSIRKQDPFCIFRVNNIVKRTKTDYGGGTYPIWDDQVNIPISHGSYQMKVEIFDKDANPMNLMGEEVIDLSKVIREKEHDGYFPVQYKRQPGGKIYLELSFYPTKNGAARPQQHIRYQNYPIQPNRPPPQTYQQKPLPHRPTNAPYTAPLGYTRISPQRPDPPPLRPMYPNHSAPHLYQAPSNNPTSPVHLIVPNHSTPPSSIYPSHSAPPLLHIPNHSTSAMSPYYLAPPMTMSHQRPYPPQGPLSPTQSVLFSPPPFPRPMPGGYPPPNRPPYPPGNPYPLPAPYQQSPMQSYPPGMRPNNRPMNAYPPY